MVRKVHKQLSLPTPPTWGGKRAGAGGKPTGKFGCDPKGRPRAGVPHLTRTDIDPRAPLHVTVHTVGDAPDLRGWDIAARIGRLLKARAARQVGCRVNHFSLQRDHLHFIVEADDRTALARGVQGLLSGVARVVNDEAGRSGKLWRDRYHARSLHTPTEVRRCLVYVLRNAAKHGSTALAVEPLSSAAWFDGFAGRGPLRSDPAPVVPASTWLLSRGWRERAGGPIGANEMPAGPFRNMSSS